MMYDTMTMNNIIILIIILFMFLVVIATYMEYRKIKQLQKYWKIEIGMIEEEMLDIMGRGYNRSLLKNNRIKYEWRIRARSYGSSHNGYSTRTYTGVRKVTIYVKNGLVEEVKPYNV